MNSLKGYLFKDTTADPHLISLVNTFKCRGQRGGKHAWASFTVNILCVEPSLLKDENINRESPFQWNGLGKWRAGPGKSIWFSAGYACEHETGFG